MGDPGQPRLDHLLYAAPDLPDGIARIEALLGVRPAVGGRHPRYGTRNALLALGPEVYLEVLAPDVARPDPSAPILFRLDRLDRPRLLTWVARAGNLEAVAARANGAGIPLGRVSRGHRENPDGTLLHWTLTDPYAFPEDGLVPFFLDWGDTPSPARSAPGGCRLLSVRCEHPQAGRVADALQRLELEMPVSPGPEPAIIATIRSPNGDVELR